MSRNSLLRLPLRMMQQMQLPKVPGPKQGFRGLGWRAGDKIPSMPLLCILLLRFEGQGSHDGRTHPITTCQQLSGTQQEDCREAAQPPGCSS